MTHELRKLAEAATPGPWYVFEGANSHCFDCRVGPAGDQNCAAFSDGYDATFIAAANPKTVLELLDRIAELEGAEQRGYDAAKEQAAKLARVAWLQTFYGSIADADAMNGMCEELSASIRAMVRP